MNNIPNELLIHISNYLSIHDKHNYIMTCKNILLYKNIIMKNIVYNLFYIYYHQQCMFVFLGVFNNFSDIRLCVKMNYEKYCKKKKPINKKLTIKNNFTIVGDRSNIGYNRYHGSFGFLIEYGYVNECVEGDLGECLRIYG